MPRSIATVIFALGILGLFVLDRKDKASLALWIPVAWVFLAGSRMVSQWLQQGIAMEGTPDQVLDGNPLDRFILSGLLVAGLMVLLARGRRIETLARALGPILLFLLYGAVSIIWSDYPDVALKRWVKAFTDVVMVLVILTDADPSAAVKRLLGRLGFLLIPLSVLLIVYYPQIGREHDPWTWRENYVGVATSKNGLGYVCLVFGLGSLWHVLEASQGGRAARGSGPLIAHSTVLLMTLVLFWKVNSATSLVCFLVGGGLIALTKRSAFVRETAALHFLVGAVLFLCLFGLFLNAGTDIVEALGRDPTLTGRTALWDQVLRMTVNPWFGAGFESFWLGERLERLWATYWWHPNQAHNGYLEVFLNLGWLGVALLSFVIAWGYRNVLGALRRNPEAGGLRLAFFVVALVYNLTEAAFRVMHPVWIAFLLAVAVVPEASRRQDG